MVSLSPVSVTIHFKALALVISIFVKPERKTDKMAKRESKDKKQEEAEMTVPDFIMWAAKDIMSDPRLSDLTQEKYLPMWKYGKRILER